MCVDPDAEHLVHRPLVLCERIQDAQAAFMVTYNPKVAGSNPAPAPMEALVHCAPSACLSFGKRDSVVKLPFVPGLKTDTHRTVGPTAP